MLVPTGVVLIPTGVVLVPIGVVLWVHTLLYPLLLSHAPLYPNPPSNLLYHTVLLLLSTNLVIGATLPYCTIPYPSTPSALKPPSDAHLFCIIDPNSPISMT